MNFNNKNWPLQRFPKTNNRSLRAWSAADELLLSLGQNEGYENKSIAIAHDTFGAMATALSSFKPLSVVLLKSQLLATKLNYKNNGLDRKDNAWSHPLKLDSDSIDLALVKIPKSAELFELYLSQLHAKMNGESTALCGFMTRNFTPRWLEIASLYFEDVSQSLAAKKARLIVLRQPKKNVIGTQLFHEVPNDLGLKLKQYSGVFSSSKVDIATQIFLDCIPEVSDSDCILDLACGNGVIGSYVRKSNENCELHLMDDNYLAISSAKLNIPKANTEFHWQNSMESFGAQKFDLILCNPPFHFEYETTIDIALSLFKESAKALKQNGRFYIVANTHLNYRTHLTKMFAHVSQVKQSGKFEVICCSH